MFKRPDSPPPTAVRRFSVVAKLLAVMAIVVALCGALLLQQLQTHLQQLNDAQLETLGRSLSGQSALNSVPLMLSQDWVSLNVSLKQLSDDPLVQGAMVVDLNGQVVAQVGRPDPRVFERSIESGDTLLGNLRLYLNPAPLQRQSDATLRRLVLILSASALSLLLASWLTARQLAKPLRQLLGAAEELHQGLDLTPLDEGRRDEFGEINRLLNSRFAELSVTTEDEPPAPPRHPPTMAADDALAGTTPRPTKCDDESETGAGVRLQPMIAPTAAAAPGLDAFSGASADVIQPPAPQTPATPAQADHFLLYVNQQQAGSDALDPQQRQQLLQLYRYYFERVCQLYKGVAQEDPAGNWYAAFEARDGSDGEDPDILNLGINALCASQLFKGLYRQLNRQRIQQLQPVLNLKIALTCGSSPQWLLQHARRLSQSVDANELITDQSLYDVVELNRRMLAEGQFRKVSDDTYLITALSVDFQELIDRQARHFLHQPES